MQTPQESHAQYQLVVIGSGSGGREAALLGVRQGLRTALIEADKLGGACFHSGCYAVRALQACAHQFRDCLRSGRFGNKVDLLKATLFDWMMARSRVSSRLTESFRVEMNERKIDLYQGYGQLLDNRTVQVIGAKGSKVPLIADNVVVATGSRPEFYSSSETRLVNSEELLRMPTVPERLVIVGAGHIGCEFASIYRTLGCAVTLIEKESQVLPDWEVEAEERVAKSLTTHGITVLLNQKVSLDQIEGGGDTVRLRLLDGKSVETDLVLMATGRKPNSTGFGLEALGIDDRSFLKVDEQMRLPVPGLYAVGDANGMSLLDSTAFSQARVAINSILGLKGRLDRRCTPRYVHTEPMVAAVGWSQQEAEAQGLEYLTVSDTIHLVSDTQRSVVELDVTFLKVIVDPHRW